MGPVWVPGFLVVLVMLLPLTNGQNCSTKNRTTGWHLQCKTFHVILTLNGEHRTQLRVQCPSKPDFELLRTVTNVPRLTFNELDYSYCPLPTGNRSLVDTLAGFLDRKQLTSIKRLFFVDNAQSSDAEPLGPELFADLHALEILSMKASAKMPLDNPSLFKNLKTLKWLDLREGDGGQQVAKTILRPLTNLNNLELMENGLTELPDGFIANISTLETLSLYANKLERLDKLVGLPWLYNIDLSYNRLTELREDVFEELPELSHVSLERNHLTRLPAGLLKNNTKLTKFIAKDQQSSGLVLEDGLFAGLQQLVHVSLSNCNIAELPDGLFAGAIGLKTLELDHNQLEMLPELLLRDLHNLEELKLQQNALLKMLPNSLFQHTHSLRFLNLSNNNLTTLNRQLLSETTKLEELYLDNNQLRIIDMEAFKGQEKFLTKLTLSHNKVSLYENGMPKVYVNGEAWDTPYFNTPFKFLKNVQTLDLSYNEIVTLFMDFKSSMPKLAHLDLSHNLITYIGDSNFPFMAQTTVKVVDLQSNKITKLGFRNLKDVTLPTVVLLDGNPLNCDCLVYPVVDFIDNNRTTKNDFQLKGLQCASPPELSRYTLFDVPRTELICELDEPNQFCPSECTCYRRPANRVAIINCTGRNLVDMPYIPSPHNATVGCDSIELHLTNNQLRELPMSMGEGWNAVQWLYVANNSLSTLRYDSLPNHLKTLDVRQNQFASLDERLFKQLANRSELHHINLSANPWRCDCSEPLLAFVSENVKRISDFHMLRCADGQPISTTTQSTLCRQRTMVYVQWSIAFVIVALIALLGGLFCMRYEHEIKVWLFKRDLLRWLVAEEQIDQNKQYDAFISYSHKDEAFIVDTLMPTLEREPMGFKICWHVRDFMPGELISTQITKAVEDSRRTIIVLSPNYLESVWGQMEFNTAYLQSVADKRNRVIPIIYEDIGDVETLDQELRAYLKTNTYVRWGDPWFWDKLRYAMPHTRRPKGVQATNNIRMASIDKLNLLPTNTNQTSTPSLESTPPIEHLPSGKGIANGEPLANFCEPAKLVSLPAAYIISDGKLDLPVAAK